MKNILSLLLSFVLTSQFAMASNVTSLKQAIDEFQYAMTVEWDQQDEYFAKKQQNKFRESIEDLMANGVTVDELKAVFNVNSPVRINELEAELSERNITEPAEIQNYIEGRIHTHYSRGVSWNGEMQKFWIGAAVCFMGLFILAWVTDPNK